MLGLGGASMNELELLQQKRREELATVKVMIGIYCRAVHGSAKGELCPKCQELLFYAAKRVECCPRMAEKTFCSVCSTHCYAPAKREAIREVMRYSGPRMLWHAPWQALRHLWAEHNKRSH